VATRSVSHATRTGRSHRVDTASTAASARFRTVDGGRRRVL